MSSKIYPSEIQVKKVEKEQTNKIIKTWTIWKKSSMSFVGSDGFSVYDGEGKLAFRVDNYSRKNKFLLGELVLMDAIGRPLLSLRPQVDISIVFFFFLLISICRNFQRNYST